MVKFLLLICLLMSMTIAFKVPSFHIRDSFILFSDLADTLLAQIGANPIEEVTRRAQVQAQVQAQAQPIATKGFGAIKPKEPKPEGKSRSEKKEEYRKNLQIAKSSPSIKKIVKAGDNDIVQSQRKQGNRGSGGA
jgi:hypothetical protein